MLSSYQSMFDNKAALAELAKLNPLAEGAVEADGPAAGGGAARASNRRTVKSSGGNVSGASRIGPSFAPTADPAWIKERSDLLDKMAQRTAEQQAKLERKPIKVTLPDGKVIDGTAWETSPLAIATGISKGLANAACVASVRYSKRFEGLASTMVAMAINPDGDGDEGEAEWELWDLPRPLEGDCELQLHKFDDPRGKQVFWHSSAHILGEALECLYSARLTHGPPTEGGFFYDSVRARARQQGGPDPCGSRARARKHRRLPRCKPYTHRNPTVHTARGSPPTTPTTTAAGSFSALPGALPPA